MLNIPARRDLPHQTIGDFRPEGIPVGSLEKNLAHKGARFRNDRQMILRTTG